MSWFRILTILRVLAILLEVVDPLCCCLHFPASVHLGELLSFHRVLYRTYDQARRKIKGSDEYLVNQPRLSEVMGHKESLQSLTPGNTTRDTHEDTWVSSGWASI